MESNRLVSIEEGRWTQVQKLNIPNDGQEVWLRVFGQVKLFRKHLKDQMRHYAIYLSDEKDPTDNGSKLSSFTKIEFEKLHDQHWQIAQYHRAIKQVCNIESFQVRGKIAVKNHFFAAIFGYVELQKLRTIDVISNCYKLRRDLFNEVIASSMESFAPGMEHMNSKFQAAVNA